MRQTILHPIHVQLKAKIADVQGWQMPLQYAGVTEEYYAVRTAAGLYDISDLGRIEITGPGAPELLQKTFTRDLSTIQEGMASYGLLCNESGFILDDSILFHLRTVQAESRYLLTSNAVNTEKIIAWLKKHAGDDAVIDDTTERTAQIALQGPKSDVVLDHLAGLQIKKLKPKKVKELSLYDTPLLISRTGYTGELGYELIIAKEQAEKLWKALLEAGKDIGIMPCGIASRDLLRLEAGYVLYGSDIDETRNPLEARLGAVVDLKKDFIGKEALVRKKSDGVEQLLAGFMLLGTGIPRGGGSIFSENREIGVVTSGNHSPHLRAGIGLGYVTTRYLQAGQEIEIEIRDREIAAKIVDLPFYKKK